MIPSAHRPSAASGRAAARGTAPPNPPLSLAEDVMRDEHFHKLAREIEARIGIRLPPSKKAMVEGRLRRRARTLGLASLDAYGRHLFDDGGWGREFAAVVDCVTTNKTDFFREPEHYAILCDLVIPQLLAPEAGRASQPVKLWSAACSIGAEAYTLAMVLAALRERRPFAFSILGTDINTDVVDQARRGVYGLEMIEPVPADMRRAFTMRAIDERRREFRVVPELRALTRFRALNLMHDPYDVDQDFNVIFCRNVLIYFDKDVQQAVVARLARHLKPKGFLFLGHAEAGAGGDHPGLRQVAPTVFQRGG